MKQTTFAFRWPTPGRRSARGARSFSEIEAIVPWARLVALIVTSSHSPNSTKLMDVSLLGFPDGDRDVPAAASHCPLASLFARVQIELVTYSNDEFDVAYYGGVPVGPWQGPWSAQETMPADAADAMMEELAGPVRTVAARALTLKVTEMSVHGRLALAQLQDWRRHGA